MNNESDKLPAEPRHFLRLMACVAIGAGLWFAPVPSGLAPNAWHIFAVFVATILSFLLRPLPMGVCVLLGLVILATTGQMAPYEVVREGSGSLTPIADTTGAPDAGNSTAGPLPLITRIKTSWDAALSGFADSTVWLVVAAFMISTAMVHSGLGRRIGLIMVSWLGRTTLGLGYAIAAAELVLGPFVPSNTARGGGIMAPIVNSLCGVLGSHPHDKPRRAGEYLMLCGAHLNLVTAAMFLTGMAANPLVRDAAKDVWNIDFTWEMWVLGSCVPGLVSLATLPLLLYWIAKPDLIDATEARQLATHDLKALGPWTGHQQGMAAVLLVTLLLWATGSLQEHWLGVSLPAPLVAMLGVLTLVVAGILPYQRMLRDAGTWDTLLWLGGLISMAEALRTSGFVEWLSGQVQLLLGDATGVAAMVLLAVLYFFSMYAFSMLTGHIMAFVAVFFGVAQAVGAPPWATIALFAYFSNLCGATTHYSTGPVVIYFGFGYVSIGRWMLFGFIVSLFHLAVWLGFGIPWWYALGWLELPAA
jgi:divalent anion:Na+ symporter, DASS family